MHVCWYLYISICVSVHVSVYLCISSLIVYLCVCQGVGVTVSDYSHFLRSLLTVLSATCSRLAPLAHSCGQAVRTDAVPWGASKDQQLVLLFPDGFWQRKGEKWGQAKNVLERRLGNFGKGKKEGCDGGGHLRNAGEGGRGRELERGEELQPRAQEKGTENRCWWSWLSRT